MEYYGKILCISHNDLTYDDRPMTVDGKTDYSHSRCLKGQHPSMLSEDILAPIMSESNYKLLSFRGQINVMRQGKGLGSYALIEFATLPERFKERIKEKYGDLEPDILKDWFGKHYSIDAEARRYYMSFRFEDGSALPPEKVTEYSVNASVLTSVLTLMADTNVMRRAMGGKTVNWGKMTGAISYYKTETGHTLPMSPNRFHERVNTFQKEGYEALISKKFKNQNGRRVSYMIERLLLCLDADPTRPSNTTVAEWYNAFVTGELEVYDPETGELYDPKAFTDKKGNPIVLTRPTIANYLNLAKNRALRAKLHDTQWDFNNAYRPYHLRHSGEWSLSKISLDDRDLPRPMHNGQRVKAYYAYDVVSGAVVGYAYNRLKTRDLFLDCMRNMFQTLDRNGLGMPAELEVEHHLVENFADGLMKAGEVFPLVRWCNPGNSREKRAEHFNRAKKYGVEKRLQVGIGRWYAKLESNRVKVEKVYDETNNTYKERSYSYEELVADDLRAIMEYNNQPHPNKKKYGGMSRWDVLMARQNPELQPWDKAQLYRYIGEHTKTTIRQNMYCTVQYKEYRLPTPHEIEKLAPRDMTVDAYYLADQDGNINEVYIYQKGKYICTCGLMERYNEATAEQTAADKAAYTEQAKYVSQFDKMMRDEKIHRVAILPKTEREAIDAAAEQATAVVGMEHDEGGMEQDDFSDYMDTSRYSRAAVASV